ncbi:MAG: aldo/keto reductase [Anaerolineae bacterium]|nr:aldo/keto reductase [Anaerolineae bacterium]
MQYRRFGSLDWKSSALGFGCMRLPTVGGDRSNVDEAEAVRMLRYAIDRGVNYLDTAYPYHGGNSERVVGKALKDGYRDKVKLATKLPVRMVEQTSDFDRFLDEQLSRLQTDHVDFYLFHGLRTPRWETVQRLDLLSQADRALADGRVCYMGFSFHDDYQTFCEIIDGYDRWTMCQIQYNYMNETYQARTAGLRYAAAKGLATVVMEPLLGGKLANPPQPVQEIWNRSPSARSAVGWALHWLWNKPEVSVVLSGMSTFDQVVENVASADASGVGALSAQELALVEEARAKYEALCPIPCTQCAYCMPCPNGVEIPRNFSTFNNGTMYNAFGEARHRYSRMPEDQRASACIACRECEELCPQDIPISEWMPVVDAVLGQGLDYASCTLPG